MPSRALEAHLRAHAPFGAHLEIDDVDLGNPFLVDTSGWAVAEAKDAMRRGLGRRAASRRASADPSRSSPTSSEVFPDAQILVTGVEDPDSRAHSPNESLHLGRLPARDPHRGAAPARAKPRIGTRGVEISTS